MAVNAVGTGSFSSGPVEFFFLLASDRLGGCMSLKESRLVGREGGRGEGSWKALCILGVEKGRK